MQSPEEQAAEWFPHADKQFGHFDRTLRKYAPRRLGELRRVGRQMRGLVGSRRRGSRR
jgi:hypothetical protein